MPKQDAVPEDDGDDFGFVDPDPSPDVVAITNGDPFRSFLELPTRLIDEARVHFDADGLHIRAVDPANVGMIDVDLHADGFSAYDFDATGTDEVVVGVVFDYLTGAVDVARKRQNDPVRVDVLNATKAAPRVRTSVLRPDQNLRRTSDFFTVDPDTIRQEPDLPDLELPYRADPDPDAFRDAVHAVDANHDHAWFSIDGSDLIIGSQPAEGNEPDDTIADTVAFPNAAWVADDSEPSGTAGSLFSLDYLKDMATAIKKAKVERLTLHFGDEFPAFIDFDHPDWGIDGAFMLAPRIQSD